MDEIGEKQVTKFDKIRFQEHLFRYLLAPLFLVPAESKDQWTFG